LDDSAHGEPGIYKTRRVGAITQRPIEQQLARYLADAHSIEEQALTQLKRAPGIVGDPQLADLFREHLVETERQESLVRARLQAHGETPSAVKDAAGRAGGLGMVFFARAQPDTPGKLTAHAYSFEHLELAAYEMLRRIAERAGDKETAEVAGEIAGEEQRMAGRLADNFDCAVDASLRELADDDEAQPLDRYLGDAHAIEEQSMQLLQTAPHIVGDDQLAALFTDHLAEAREHGRRIDERLAARDANPSMLKDVIMRTGGFNIGGFFGVQPDTPAKLAGFAFAFEHLEIAAYELLCRVALRAGDMDTAEVAGSILAEERAAADRIGRRWDRAIEAALAAPDMAAPQASVT
jgi:ferritin-like metal-binding protein YciE